MSVAARTLDGGKDTSHFKGTEIILMDIALLHINLKNPLNSLTQ